MCDIQKLTLDWNIINVSNKWFYKQEYKQEWTVVHRFLNKPLLVNSVYCILFLFQIVHGVPSLLESKLEMVFFYCRKCSILNGNRIDTCNNSTSI